MLATAVAGCNGPAAPPPPSSLDRVAPPVVATSTTGATTAPVPVVARINGLSVTRADLDEVLYKSYGINLLAELVELDLAKQALAQKGMTLDEADVGAERQRSLAKMFENDTPDHYEQDFKQLKAEKHLTDEEFDLGFRMTAALRKLARPQITGQVTDAAVRQAFGILYGENRRIADIAVANLAEAGQVHQRLAGGEAFEMVAREMSLDHRTAPLGGEWPPFSTKTPGVPAAIMEAAFGLRPGQVSADVIADGNRYHVVKLLQVIPPKVVKYDDVKDDVRRQVEEQLVQSAINQFRDQLRQITATGLQVDDPTLKRKWDQMLAAQQPATGATLTPGEATARIGRAERPATTRAAP